MKLSDLSKIGDALTLIATIEALKAELAGVNDKEVGETTIIEVPEAKRLNALLLKGKAGSRFRITGVVLEREK